MRRAPLFFFVLVAACKRDAPPSAGTPDASITVEPTASSVTSASAAPPPSAVASIEPAAPRSETKAVEDLTPPESADLENPLVKIGKTTIWGVADGDDATRIFSPKCGK